MVPLGTGVGSTIHPTRRQVVFAPPKPPNIGLCAALIQTTAASGWWISRDAKSATGVSTCPDSGNAHSPEIANYGEACGGFGAVLHPSRTRRPHSGSESQRWPAG